MKSKDELAAEVSLLNEQETRMHIQALLDKNGCKHSIDTFLTSISGRWVLRPQNSNVYRYAVDRLAGDVVWFDRSWMASGTGIFKVLNNGHENQAIWSLDYDQATDAITWRIGSEGATFANVSNPNSPIQHRVSVPEKKLMVVVRADVTLGSYVLLAGSNLTVQ